MKLLDAPSPCSCVASRSALVTACEVKKSHCSGHSTSLLLADHDADPRWHDTNRIAACSKTQLLFGTDHDESTAQDEQ
jgi:hypothetical protein